MNPKLASPTGTAVLVGVAALFLLMQGGAAYAPDQPVGQILEPLESCEAPAEVAGAEEVPATEPVAPVRVEPAQPALVGYLARRYYIASEASARMVLAAQRAAREVGLDPLLLLAVVAIESRFNPFAESAMGAKGLMQIIPKYHQAKLRAHGGEEAVLDPERNILVGAQILQEYVRLTGTLEAGLQFYNGAMQDGSAQYASKVLAERARLQKVISGGKT